MKKIISIFILMMLLMLIIGVGTAAASSILYSGDYELKQPRKFNAVGFKPILEGYPFDDLQGIMEYTFIDGKSISNEFTVTYSAAGETADLILTTDLTYAKERLTSFDSVFVTGTFRLINTSGNITSEHSGDVTGQIAIIDTYSMEFDSDAGQVPALLLIFQDSDDPWNWYVYLEMPGEDVIKLSGSNVDLIIHSDYYDHESRPHIPSPRSETDVAVGVGLSTIGFVVLNALTKTTPFGNTPYNSSFDPTAPAKGGPSASASGGSGAAAASSATPSSATAGATGSPGSGSAFFGAIKDFFRNLYMNLRDMLADEGRSYASGKLAEILGESIPDDIDGE
ncbi:MAG: hypothetical protein R3232_04885 [Clostridia bacterium]|nr:hypothetical protein [Clostridia bacterium]